MRQTIGIVRIAATIVATAGVALPAAACGSTAPQAASVGSSSAARHPSVSPAQHAPESGYQGFARCMRSHGVSDFPDPVRGSGGHPGFHLQGGSNSDLNSNNPAFQRGVAACGHVLGHQFRFVFTPSGVGKGA
jgi:hypothetical protein